MKGYLRLKQVLDIIPVAKSNWWAGVKTGRYPRSYKLGGCTLWKIDDIDALVKDIENGVEI